MAEFKTFDTIKARATYIGCLVKGFMKKVKKEAKNMQLYQFERIYSQMEKEFGKIRKGEEDVYSMLLLPLEGNVLKIHREYPLSNSRTKRMN